MSDVTVASQGAPPPSAAPAPSNEVVINQNPSSSPNPIGSQAPPAPTGDFDGSKHHPQSRSESIRKSLDEAFRRAENPQPKGEKPKPREAKPAEARMGHNQPPEETPRINLKKRPDDQAQPARGEHGHFASKPQGDGIQGGAQNNATGAQDSAQLASSTPQGEYKRLPPHAPFAEPPPRIAEHARRDWADTPETVRGEIHRMHQEFGRAYQQYKGAHDAFQPVARFHQMAQQHGTTLEKALTNYTSIEQKLRTDPIAALDTIVNNLGLTDPNSGQRLGLRDVAYTVLSQSPEQLRQIQQGNVQTATGHQIGALHQEIAGLKNHLQQMHTQQQYSYTRSAVDQFALTHPRIDEQAFGTTVQQELKFGFDLETAYRRAEAFHPATHAAQTRDPSAQTRPVDRSIHGNPDVAPSNGASRRPQKASGSPRDAVQNAMKRLNGHA